MRNRWIAGLMASALAGSAGLARADAPAPTPTPSPSLADQFQNPPASARPRVWWHWLNGNVTSQGITQDLDWMVKVGIGGLQNFDVNLGTPVMVPHRLAYMTPEWKAAFRFAAAEADKRGLELAIATSPGWSETGGPWVAPADGLKKVVWSELVVEGGKRFTGQLPALPTVSGPFQDLALSDPIAALTGQESKGPPRHSGEIAVFAVPVQAPPLPRPRVSDAAGLPIDPAAFADASLATALSLPRGTTAAPTSLTLDYGAPVTVRSAALFSQGAKGTFSGATLDPRLEASDDGRAWQSIASIAVTQVPTTVGFAPVTARYFRLVLHPLAPAGANLASPAPGVVTPPLMAALGAAGAAPIRLNLFRLSSEPVIDRFESKAGFDIARDYYELGGADAGALAIAPAQVINLSDRVKPDGTLDWTPPAGAWKVIRIGHSLLGTTNHPAPAEATGLEVDKFDGAAVRGYMQHYLAMYRDAAGADLIGAKGVRAVLSDSIEVGAANWTPRLIEQFRHLRGYDPTPWLPTLTGVIVTSRAASDRFLYDYRRTLAELMASEHYATVAQLAHEAGLKVYGEALEDHRPSLGDDMAMRRHTDVPMAALWTFPAGGAPNPSYLADMKGAASVAHVYGQNLVAAESMTSAVTYWADSPRTLKHAIDLEFVTGVNRPVIHTSVHSPDEAGEPGLSLMIFGQYFNRHETWAELARPWIDYLARNALLLQQGRNQADVAYFYGEEAPLTGLYGDTPVADAPRTHAYDFVNPAALSDALHNEGDELVSLGGARYKVLYLGGSSRRMTVPVLKRLVELVEGGASLVGLPPQDSPSLADDPATWQALVARLWGGGAHGKGRVIASGDIESALHQQLGLAADLRFTGGAADSDLPFLHRHLADGEIYFIVNRRDRPEMVEAHFRVTGLRPELWRAESGTIEPLPYRVENGETVVPLALTGEQSVQVVFRPATSPAPAAAPAPTRPLATLADGWAVAFQPGRGAPAAISMAQLAPLDQASDPAVKYFSGIATYTTTFTAPRGWKAGQPLWLDLGEVREVAEVRVNGKLVGGAWHAPYRVELTGAARPGRNSLEVRVANLWVNRLIGDAQPGARPLTHTALPTYQASAPLLPSGLIGPVRLLGQ